MEPTYGHWPDRLDPASEFLGERFIAYGELGLSLKLFMILFSFKQG